MAEISTGGHCYCGIPDIESVYHFLCEKCKRKFHEECLKSSPASILKGDYLFHFKCDACNGGEEDFARMRLQWLQVVQLTLYNLQLTGTGMKGYFRWKEHICAFIDKHWTTFFGSHRKKTSLWHGTVAGVLSQGCPAIFTSGANELKETGWWRLNELRPPSTQKQGVGAGKMAVKKRDVTPPSPIEAHKQGLRSRRGKTSIQAAMELKAKRSTLTEAKEIRKTKLAQCEVECKQESPLHADHLPLAGDFNLSASPMSIEANQSFKFQSTPLSRGGNWSSESSLFSESSQDVASSSLLAEHLTRGQITPHVVTPASLSLISPRSGSLADYSDESSNISQSSYLTEKDLKFQATVPNLLLSDDVTTQDVDDSDLEIDPSSLTPQNSPIRMQDSPTVQEMISGLASGEKAEEGSVVDSESESESEESDTEDKQFAEAGNKRKRKLDQDSVSEAPVAPQITYQMMSSYEERNFLQLLESATCPLPCYINRLKRKLKVRQLKRERGIPLFDLDAEMNKLAQRCFGFISDQKTNIPGNSYHGGLRILDKFQLASARLPQSQQHQQPSFLNRLVGYEDDQLHPVCSPYTSRILKPFIRRDYEMKPLKLRLLEEIKAYPHRNDPSWKSEPSAPIDFCYIRPQHIASVNTLCREFFWPGIDVSECLQYPDFSCIVLYRKIVIGFAFMVPDVKQNEAYISFIFTHPEWRRAHMATFMLYHLIQTCMGKDVTLHCSVTNPAMLLYQKFGFKPEEFIVDFYDKYFPADTSQSKNAFFLRLRR